MRFLLFLSLFISSWAAQAQIVFSPGISYIKDTTEINGSKSELELQSYDLRGGYIHPSGLYLGAMYSIIKVGDNDAYAAGPTIGYKNNYGFYALFTYHLVSEYKLAGGNKFVDGMGPQFDVGWVFPLTSMFYIGPQISYRSLSYDKLETGGASTSVDYTLSNLYPYLSFWFQF